MNQNEKETSFGKMWRIDLTDKHHDFSVEAELMVFERKGTEHKHEVAELAICVHGTGVVWIKDAKPDAWDFTHAHAHPVSAGDQVRIPAGRIHWMAPSGYPLPKPLTMMILYEEK